MGNLWRRRMDIHKYRSELIVAEAVTHFRFLLKNYFFVRLRVNFCDASPHNPKRGPYSFSLLVATSCDRKTGIVTIINKDLVKIWRYFIVFFVFCLNKTKMKIVPFKFD